MRLSHNKAQAWQNRVHFFGAAAEAMRRILIENARWKSRLKCGGDHLRIEFDKLHFAAEMADDKLLLIDEALQRLQSEDPEKARVVLMKFFGGQTNPEMADVLGITERTVERHRNRLAIELIEAADADHLGERECIQPRFALRIDPEASRFVEVSTCE